MEKIMEKLKTIASIDCGRCWQRGENCEGDDCEKVIAEKFLLYTINSKWKLKN